jgi:DNA mismatch repair protein MutS2
MVRFLREADAHTLVLPDEIAVGTDPVEGAALAQALLEELIARGARVIVTTHYQALKDLAAQDARFQNASMEITDGLLRFTYRMIPGVPGRSGALDVAGKLGLDPGIVGRARSLLGSDRQRLEASLRRLEELRVSLESEKREAARMRAESEGAKRAWTEKLRQIEREREQVSRDLKAALDSRVRSAQEEIAEVIRNLQRRGTAQEADVARRRIVRLKAEVAEAIPAPAAPAEPIDWPRVAPGARVRLKRFGAEGELVEGPDASGHAQVRVGGKRLVIPARDLVLAVAPPSRSPRPRPPAAASRAGRTT